MDRNYALKFIIEQYMTTHNLKQYEFADKCEVSKSFINKICNRKQGKFNVSEMYFIRLAKGMGITSDELHKMLENIETVNFKKSNIEEQPLDLLIKDVKKLNDEKLKLIHSITKEILKCRSKKMNLLIPIFNTILNMDIHELESIYESLKIWLTHIFYFSYKKVNHSVYLDIYFFLKVKIILSLSA